MNDEVAMQADVWCTMLVRTMFFGRFTSRELREDNERLRAALQRAQESLFEYRRREQDLVDALVRARADARELLDAARKSARETVERASVETEHLRAAARAEVAAAEQELTRLREIQGVLGASLQQSLALLSSVPAVTPSTDAPIPAVILRDRASSSTPSPADTQPAPAVASTADPEPSTLAVDSLPPPGRALPFASRAAVEPSRSDERRSRRVLAGLAAGVVVALGITAALVWPSWRGRVGALADARAAAAGASSAEAASGGGTRHAAPETRPSLPAHPERGSPLSSAATRAPGAARTGSDGVAVAVDASRPVWLRVEVDGRQTVARMLREREHLDLHGARAVTLRAGDAGAVSVSIDGQAATPLGRTGAVVTRRIDAVSVAPAKPPHLDRTSPREVPHAAAASDLPVVTPVSPSGASASTAQPAFTPVVGGLKQLPAATAQAPAVRFSPSPSTPTALPDGLTVEENDVVRAHQSYFDALRRGDQAAIRRVLARSFSVSGSPPVGAAGLTVSNLSVQISGVGAVVSGTASRQADNPGTPDRLLFSEVWTNTEGAWQLLSVRFLQAPAGR